MGLWSGTKRLTKSLVDVPRWMGYKQLVEMSKPIAGMAKDLFIPKATKNTETFAEAMQRLNLTEVDLQQRAKEFKQLLMLWLVLFLAVFAYATYLAFQAAWYGFVPALTLSFLILIQALRQHFWLYQLKQRKLGCTLREWFYASFIGK